MSFFKYYKETRDADGEQLWWPGGPAGYPYRGSQPPQTKNDEYDNLQLTGKFRNKTFYLSKPEDAAEYTRVRDKCSNNLWYQLDKDRQWDPDTNGYRIYLEWLELAYDSSPQLGAKDAIKEYTKDATTIPAFSKLAGVRQTW